MTTASGTVGRPAEDVVSNILKWILLVVAIGCFALFAWATVLTYQRAAPESDRFVTSAGTTLMSADDILTGKAGFQRADLMDYGSLYGMDSYFGQDYTAFALMRLANLTEEALSETRFHEAFAGLAPDRQAAVRDEMRRELQTIDLTKPTVTLPDPLAAAIVTLRTELAENLRTVDLATGWTPAYSLDEREAAHTADFLIYAALTTVARRPDTSWSWTENWPYEPEVGNTPTTNTFIWPADLERADVPGAVADRRGIARSDASILVGSHPPRKPDLGGDAQYRDPVCVRLDPSDRDREVVHDHRFLAVVGGPSLGRAVLRVLRREHERLSADGRGAGVAAIG